MYCRDGIELFSRSGQHGSNSLGEKRSKFAADRTAISRGGTFTPPRLFTAAILIFIVASRWALAPPYLYYFDSANFALALKNFNPALHQPQPPGYPLFVALTRLLHLWIREPETVFLVAGLLAACAAAALIRVLASSLFGRAAGILAMALLASNPIFWFGGITNEIRVFLALCSLGVGLCAWRAIAADPGDARWLYATFTALGVAAGFRPVAAFLLLPACLWAWARKGFSVRQRLLAIAMLLAVVVPCAAVTVAAMGGPLRVSNVLWGYAVAQFQGTSAIFGAAPRAAFQMFLNALVWNFRGAIVWLWAIPLAVRQPFPKPLRVKAAFLALMFLPTFLFSSFIHIGDPDQALASVAILCVAGGGVLASALSLDAAALSWKRVARVSVAVIAAGSFLFFVPPTRIAKAASYKAAAAVNRMTAGAITSVEALSRDGPVTILHYGSAVASRQLMYYFPDDYVVELAGRPDQPDPNQAPRVFYHHQALQTPPGKGLVLPGSRRILCLVPLGDAPPGPQNWRKYGSVFFLSPVPPGPFQIGPFTLDR